MGKEKNKKDTIIVYVLNYYNLQSLLQHTCNPIETQLPNLLHDTKV